MELTKIELANKVSGEVRQNATLFALFQKYLIEDWGYIPSGCFGCDFLKHFTKWAKPYKENLIIENNIKKIQMADYILKDENYKDYFNGEVISKYSSSEDWITYINANPNQIEKRKELFIKLPSEISTPEEKEIENKVIEEIEEEKKNDLTPTAGVKRKRK